jgi:copper chaperone
LPTGKASQAGAGYAWLQERHPEPSMIELILPTMTCGHCVRTVTQTVQTVDTAARVEIDLPAHRVRIDSQREAQDFAKALAAEGYAPAP